MDSSRYICPYTSYEHYGIVPVAILTDAPDKYINAARVNLREMLGDKEWNAPDCDITDTDDLQKTYLSQIDNIILGTGYTCGTIISDGTSSTEPLVLELSNGDHVLCFAKVWYNK
jgi:hypothetical protein